MNFPGIRPSLLALLVSAIGCTSAGVSVPPVLSNVLPPGVESNPAQFRQQHTRFSGRPTHTRTRRANCERGAMARAKCVVEIAIEVDATAAVPNPDAPPAAGYAIARLNNLDALDIEEEYDMVPSSQAEYFVWIDAMPGGSGTRWTLLYVPKGSGSVQTAYVARLSRCKENPGARPPNVDFAEFAGHSHGQCGVSTNNPEPSPALASIFTARPLSALVTAISSLINGGAKTANGMWFECSGCCT
jgi:hypothetical protein